MKPHALVPYPMTPPDDPPEPSLEGAVPCPQCQYPPQCMRENRGAFDRHGFRLYCDQNHVDGGWATTLERAIEYWNTECETISGENLKAEGVAKVSENNETWMVEVMEYMRRLAKSGIEFTAEDLRTYCGTWANHHPPKSPNAWGAAFSVAAKQGLIVRVGYTKNHLASAHSRIVSTWKGAK